MDNGPVMDDSNDFTPLAADEADRPGPAAVDSQEEFVPLRPPAATGVRMPTPGQVLHQSDRKLDTVPFEFADIRALAQRILKRAQEQGQQKIDAARKQVAAMEKEAHDKAYQEAFPKGREEGYAKGLAEGMAAADAKIAAAAESEKESLRQNAAPVSGVLQQLVDAINSSRAQLMAQAEGDLLLLALDLAKRLVGHELSIDPDAIRPLAVECIGLVTDRTGITARVNPEDYRVMEAYYPDLKAMFPDLGPITIVADPAVERGGMQAATREAEVDMRLATRLAAFEEVILGYSGEAAVAPWSRIPEDAIQAAKQASAVSSFQLPPAGAEAAEEDNSAGTADPAAGVPDESPTPEPTTVGETRAEIGDGTRAAEPRPGGDAGTGEESNGQTSPPADDYADLADLADLANQIDPS